MSYLSGEDVAAGPGDISAELEKRFDEDGRLDGHVKASGDAGALQRLGGAVLFAEHHQTGHLILVVVEDFTAPFGQADIGHLVREFLLRTHDERSERFEFKTQGRKLNNLGGFSFELKIDRASLLGRSIWKRKETAS